MKSKTFRRTKPAKRVPIQRSLEYRRRKRSMRAASSLGVEKKYLDVYASSINIPAPTDCAGGEMQPEGGCTDCLSVPAQGDTEQQRDGKKIMMKSIFVEGLIRAAVLQDQADVPGPPVTYVALVLDTQTNGSTIVSEQVFKSSNDTPFVNGYPLRNMDYTNRYRVLAHKTFVHDIICGTDGANTLSCATKPEVFTLAYNGEIPMTFSATTANVTSCTDNSLHIIAFASSTTPQCTISYNSRMRFVG